jgi:hypothetical protein
MCRLGWTDDMELWDLAFHKYSDGSGRRSPEACCDCAAQVYLR